MSGILRNSQVPDDIFKEITYWILYKHDRWFNRDTRSQTGGRTCSPYKELLLLCESRRKIVEISGMPLSLLTVEGRSYPCFVALSRAFVKLRKATINFIMSVCPFVRPSAWNNSTPKEQIFIKFDIWIFFRKSIGINQVLLKSYKNNRYCAWRQM